MLVAPRDARLAFKLAPGADIAAALGEGRIALAEPGSVPAGKYAKAAFEKLGLWPQLESRYIATENVRAALALAARAEVPLAAVYRSDAVSEPAVRVIDTFPAGSHEAIAYPIAALRDRDSAATKQLLQFLRGPAAQAVLRRWGFSVAGTTP